MDLVSLRLAKKFLGEKVRVKIDRPMGSKHPKWGFDYPVNYGYIEGVVAPDGDELDAYLLKVEKPVKSYEGKAVAIIHRLKDDDDKLVVIPEGETIENEEIDKLVEFQEQWFEYKIVRLNL